MTRCCAILLLGLCLGSGCASRPEAAMHISYSAEASSTTSTSHAFAIDVDGVAVDRLPGSKGEGDPFSTRSTLIIGPANEIKAASPSPAEWVVVDTDLELPSPGYHIEYGTVQAARRSRIVVPDGATAVLAIGTAARNIPPSVEVILRATPGTPDLQLRAIRRATEEESVLDRGGEEAQTIRVPWPLPQRDGNFTLLVPGVNGASRPTLWRLTARPLSDDEQTEARTLTASFAPTAPSNAQAAALAESLRRATTAQQARRSLAFAALDAGAALTSEAAILADDGAILKLVTSAAESLSTGRINDTGWTLDRSTIAVLGRLHGDGVLDRSLAASLSARFGEVGRDVGTLARLAAASASRADFEARLTAEHLIYLDDASPSPRVRAFDWLSTRSAAPPGFDPLGSSSDRREALDRHLETLSGGNRP